VADDPFAVLGVEPDTEVAELRAARRRLAKDLHPDHVGGDAEAMRRLNAAFEAAVAELARRQRLGPETGATVSQDPDENAGPVRRPGGRFVHDVASFTIEALPAEAFEAVLIVGNWLGDVLVDEPPYQLDVALGEPFDCWCRLDLVPDAGASTVAVTLASLDGRPVPDLDTVRDAWVANLNTLGRPD
jgi:hypothetical protein